MKTFKELREAAVKGEERTATMHPEDMLKHIGKSKFNAVTKHPWYHQYFAHHHHLGTAIGMRYRRNKWGHEQVDVAHGPVGEGEKSIRRMVTFDISSSGRKSSNAHLFHNNGSEKRDGNLVWRHIKSQHNPDD